MADYTFTSAIAERNTKRVLTALEEQPRTRAQLSDKLHLSKQAMVNYIAKLRIAPRQIYITAWDGRAPVYAVGCRADAKPPRKRTAAERFKALKKDPEAHSRFKTKRRVEAALKRARDKPISWLSALM